MNRFSIYRLGRLAAAAGCLTLLLLSLAIGQVVAQPPSDPVSASAPQYQLLTNPGMESFDPPYDSFEGVSCQVASGWQRFWYDGPEPCWMDTRVFAGSHLGVGWVERIQGDTSQILISTEPYSAGLRQRVTGLTPGLGYGFHAAMLTIYQTSAPPAVDGTMIKQVGIDPTGGLDPQASSVVWSPPNDHDEGPWDIDQRLAVYAQGPAMTVFIRVISPLESGGLPYLNYSFLDSAILARTPEVRATSPLESLDLTFNVRWDNAVPAPGGGRLRWYDVQWLDEDEGVWHDWLERASSVEAAFTGLRGHTYRFRARAWQRYPNGAHLYGPYRPEGDTSTTVAGSKLAGRVLSHTGEPIAGATVAITGTSRSTTTDRWGQYTLNTSPGPEPQTVTVRHPDWASPSPRHDLTFALRETQLLTWTLRPLDDALVNGEFEAGLDGWTVEAAGGFGSAVVTDPVHTGRLALALTGAVPGAADSLTAFSLAAGVAQTVTLTNAWEPAISFWYRHPDVEAGGQSDAEALENIDLILTTVARPGDDPTVTTTRVVTPDLSVGGWQHAWSYVGPANQAFTGTVALNIRLLGKTNPATGTVFVDEISLGATPGGPYRLYLPLARRGP